MDNKELSAYRAGLFRKEANWEKAERIPLVSFFVTWKILDSEYTLTEAMSDYEKMERVVREHQEKYCFDVLFDYGIRNAYRVACAMDSPTYIIDDVAGCVSVKDINVASPEDAKEIAVNYNKFMWEKGMTAKYPWWGKDTPLDKVQNAYNELMKYFGFIGKIKGIMASEYGMPSISAPNPYPAVSMENIFGFILGMRGTALMMRRDKAGLHGIIDSMNELTYNNQLEALKGINGRNDEFCFDYLTAMLAHNFMNLSQWEEFYWPYLKNVIEVYREKHCNMLLFTEGNIIRYKDYFNDYEKGLISFLPELDDVFELRKEIPNAAIVGGMPNVMLGLGTKEECLERADKVCRELGSDGGFMFCQDKMGSFRNDCNPENLKAVNDYVRNLKL